ncbi:MAG TPA: class I SAM-dependent methyltransferase [Rudaea sp.]
MTNTVAPTAFYCCALRARDAARPQPICGDTFAQRFMDDARWEQMAPLIRLRGPAESNAARHRIIDDLLREELARDPRHRVLILGAGFDTRAFRLPGGRWWEFDDAALFDFKEQRLPAAQAPHPLTRRATDFASETPVHYLAPLASDEPTTVVLEGVSMYLPHAALAELAATIRRLLPNARFVCDLISPKFRARYSGHLRAELLKLGARFADEPTHARGAIENEGWYLVERLSIVDRARRAGLLPVPGWLLATFLRELRDGYAIYVFEPERDPERIAPDLQTAVQTGALPAPGLVPTG